MRQLFLLVFACTCLQGIQAQKEAIYRRGLSLSVEFGVEGESEVFYLPKVPLTQPDPLSIYNRRYVTTFVAPGNDTLNYFPAKSHFSFKQKPDLHSQRYNLQIRLEKKLLSGLEFGGGLFLSRGWYNTRLVNPSTDLPDFIYFVSRKHYHKSGITSHLKFDVFRGQRLQPSIGIQTIFLHLQVRTDNQAYLVPRYYTEIRLPDAAAEVVNSFAFDLRIVFALTYSITEDIMVAVNTSVFSPETPSYLGLQLKYRLTDY